MNSKVIRNEIIELIDNNNNIEKVKKNVWLRYDDLILQINI